MHFVLDIRYFYAHSSASQVAQRWSVRLGIHGSSVRILAETILPFHYHVEWILFRSNTGHFVPFSCKDQCLFSLINEKTGNFFSTLHTHVKHAFNFFMPNLRLVRFRIEYFRWFWNAGLCHMPEKFSWRESLRRLIFCYFDRYHDFFFTEFKR